MRKYLLKALMVGVVMVAASGCSVMMGISKDDAGKVSSLNSEIEKAKAEGAMKCAPVELARAEAAVVLYEHEATEPEEEKILAGYRSKADAALKDLQEKVKTDCKKTVAPPPPPPPPAPAPPPPPPPPPAPKDSDGDGVIDPNDKCPDTPKGVKVDDVGCPLDTDGDGVPDYIDQCPTTPKGVPVDAVGCHLFRQSIIINVEFEFGKSEVRPQYKDEIAKAADFMKKYPGVSCTIEGHTDDVGTNAYNKKLSQARAEAVKKYMVDNFGIDAKRLGAKGYGEEMPIASNKTPEGRQKNRRIEAAMSVEYKQ